MKETEGTAAVVQRVLPAPPDVVYDEWLDPGALSEWMCPHPARPTRIEIDPQVGGRLRIDIEENGVQFTVAGDYLELDRPRRLRFAWSCSTWPDPNVRSVVTVTLEPHGDGATLMTIHHALPPDLVDQHRNGWTLIAEQLAAGLSAGVTTSTRHKSCSP